jgi:hypothetical protein
MKLYNSHPNPSIEMVKDEPFLLALPYHDIMIESGTFIGTGSTTMLASLSPKKLVTIEADFLNFEKAVTNLAGFPFVTPYWGLSVKKDEALEFIAQNNYEGDFYVDSEDPVAFYTNEVETPCFKEDLLRHFLNQYKDSNPLILLDSAGGIGFLEYSVVREIMGSRPHTLVLDDIHHVKHYRSFEEASKIYTQLYVDKEQGRCILSL